MNIPAPVVEVVSLSRLVPWPKNPRKSHAIAQIAASVEAFGYLAPIIVQARTYRILAGHGRLEALRTLGVESVPVIVADVSDDQADLYTLADNKTTELAEWDFSKMADLLLDFDDRGLDTQLTGFSDEEMTRIMNWAPETEAQEAEEVPLVPAESVSLIGDLWEMDRHRLLCGDSTSEEAVARLMGGEKAILMNTDPPYGIAYDSASLHVNGSSYEPIIADEMQGAQLQDFLEKQIRAAVPHLTDNCAFYLWHPMLTQGTFFAAAAAADILISRQIIWVKPQMIFGRGEYHWKHELCFFGWRRGNRPPFYGERNQVTVWEVPYDGNRNERDHPTQKPIALFEIPMKNHTKAGDLVFEPFSGSGSQLIAAEKLGRRCFAMELAPAYVDVAVKRWQTFTGRKAKNLTRIGIEL